MIINYCKTQIIFIFLLYLLLIYCQDEDETKQEDIEDQEEHIKLDVHLKVTEKMVYDVLVNKMITIDYALKSLLSDYIYLLIETIICIRKNETDGFHARAVLMRHGGPIFLRNYSSHHLISNSCDWNVSTGEVAVIMKEIEDLYSKIVRLDTDNCPTAPTSVKVS